MVKFFGILLTGILTSFFFFPFEFTFVPGINVKMMLAVVGLGCAAYELIRRKNGFTVPLELIVLSVIAASVSLISLLSISINQTPDSSYASYIMSFFVWLGAAFAVCFCVKSVHGRVNVYLVLNYLTAVCLFQCAFALVVDNFPSVAGWTNRTVSFGQEVAVMTKRLYAIGAMLDIAGVRFAVVLAALGFYLAEFITISNSTRLWYIVSFVVISVIGNMIARTTIVGTVIGLAFVFIGLLFRPSVPGSTDKMNAFLSWLSVGIVSVLICVVLYNTNDSARHLFRFAFEGFFSLSERGYWEVSSNEVLKEMVIFPETLHTWFIGDGYFMNSRYDPNYLGEATTEGYYMMVDIGYLRFIFYFGVLGLLCIMSVIIGSAIVCMRHFPREKWLFLMALLVGLAVWLKVSTDIFCFFALFLSAAALQEEDPEEALQNA